MDMLSVRTTTREEMLDVTSEVQQYLDDHGYLHGIVTLYSPHTTAGVTINEGADPDVARDVIVNLKKLIPHRGDYHHSEGNSDAHIKTSLLGPSQQVIVEDGRLCMGTWQRIFFVEFDGPRSRKLWIKWMGD